MNLNQSKEEPKLWLRWVLVLSVLGLIAAGGAAAFTLKNKAADKKAVQALAVANELSLAAKTAEAIAQIEIYLARFPENTSVLRQYADRVVLVPEPNNGHVRKAMDAHRRILALEPENQESVLALLEIYEAAGMSTEAVKQAEMILEKEPDHVAALMVKARQLTELGRFDEAYATLDRLHTIDVLDLEANRLRLLIMKEQGLRTTQMITWADSVARDAGDDSRGILLRAFAFALGSLEDRRAAEALMENLAFGEDADESVFDAAIQINDLLGAHQASLALIQQATIERGFAAFRPSLIKRLWDAQQADAIVALFADNETGWDFTNLNQVLPLVGWSYLSTGQVDTYRNFVAARRENTRARYELLWYELLDFVAEETVRATNETADLPIATERIEAITDSATRDAKMRDLVDEGLDLFPWDPYLHYWAGRFDAMERRFQEAIAHLGRTIAGARFWLPPNLLLVEARLRTQQPVAAYQLAIQLLERDQSLATVTLFLRAAQANLDDLSSDHFLQVAAIVEEVQIKIPMADLAALEVDVLVRQGDREAAIRVLNRWLDDEEVLAEDVLIALARVDQKHRLGASIKIQSISESAYGQTPAMAAIDAIAVTLEDGAQAGLAAFDEKRPVDAENDEAARWDLTRAQLMERMQLEEASEYWLSLVDRYPTNSTLLTVVSATDSLWLDLATAQTVVQQLGQELGEQTYEYRIAVVRLKLAQSIDLPKTQQDRILAEAVSELANLTRQYPYLLIPQLLMAQTQERLGKAALAAQYYGQAFVISPSRVDILLAQASSLVRAGQFTVAKSLMQDHEINFNDKPAELLAIAAWWRQHGEQAAVSRLVSQASALMPENRALQLEQARLKLIQGQEKDALAWLSGALATPDVATIMFAARLYGQLGQLDGLNAALVAIGQLPEETTEAQRAWLKAECLWRLGDQDQAQGNFAQALNDPSTAYAAAEGWLLACLSGTEPERLALALETMSDVLGLRAPLSEIVDHQAVLIAGYTPETRLVLLEAVRGRLPVLVCSEVFSEMTRVREQQATWRDIQPTLAGAVGQHPESPSLAGLEIVVLLQSAQVVEAVTKASAAAEVFPDELPIHLLHLTARNAAQHWREVVQIGSDLANQGSSAGRVGAITAARAALKLSEAETTRQMLLTLDSQENILAAESPELTVLWLAAAYADATPVHEITVVLDTLVADSPIRSALLSVLIETRMRKTAASAKTALMWIDQLDKLVPTDDLDGRQILGVLARASWDQWQTTELSDRVVVLLESLFEHESKASVAALMLGQMKEEQGELDQAGMYYQDVLDRQPKNLVALNNYAMVTSALGQHDRALELALQAKAVAPQTTFVLDTVALVGLAGGNLEYATQAIEEALALAPDVAEWRITACKVYLAASQIDAAAAQVAVLKTLNTQGRLTADDRVKMRELENQLEVKKTVSTQASAS